MWQAEEEVLLNRNALFQLVSGQQTSQPRQFFTPLSPSLALAVTSSIGAPAPAPTTKTRYHHAAQGARFGRDGQQEGSAAVRAPRRR